MTTNRPPAPRPGAKVRGSRTGRPIMVLLDLLGRRWALRVLWELRDKEPSFRELKAACDEMSTSVLNDRLSDLRDAGLIEHAGESGYRLTPRGRDLLERLAPLDSWAKSWARAFEKKG